MVAAHHLDWASVLLGKVPGQPVYSVPELLNQLNEIHAFNITIPLLTIAHAFAVYTHLFRDERLGLRPKIGRWQSFLCFMIGGTGGSIITALLLSHPIPVFNMTFFPIMVAGWTCLTFVPGAYHFVAEIQIVSGLVAVFAAVNRALCVCQGVEMALRAAPGEYLLACLCGIIISSGGGVLVDLFQLNHPVAEMKAISVPDLSRRLALIATCSLAYTMALSQQLKAQGPWGELVMLIMAFVLGSNGFWNNLASSKSVVAQKPKLHIKKKD